MPESFGRQQGDAWVRYRCGRITGSRMADVCSYLKDGKTESAKRYNYRMELIAARLTGRTADHYVTPAMQWGIDTEEAAVLFYEAAFGVMSEPCGFFVHPDMPFSGASPDRLIDDDGLLECKAPETVTHLEYILEGKVPDQYMPQIQWELACTGRKWADFLSYDPRIQTENLRFFCRRVERDEALIAKYTAEVLKMEAEINAFLDKHECKPLAPFPVDLKEPEPALTTPGTLPDGRVDVNDPHFDYLGDEVMP
jgi:putative phage-type endonuclease